MGMVLMVAMAVGGIVGLVINGILGTTGLIMTARNSNKRARVWLYFFATVAIAMPIIVFAVYSFPYAQAKPGSDYDIVMKNLFLQAVGYCASPGAAALIAALATYLAPRKPAVST